MYSALNLGFWEGHSESDRHCKANWPPPWASILHPFPRGPYRLKSLGGPETLWSLQAAFGVWLSRPATCSPGRMTAHPSITLFSQGVKGLNFNCSTKGYFSGLQILVQCEYAERGQECKCIDAVPRRPCAPALCKIPSGFYFAEAMTLLCVTFGRLALRLQIGGPEGGACV